MGSDPVEVVLQAVRAAGGRMTTGRRAIVTALVQDPNAHLTAEQILTMVQDEHPDVHLSTVYRTLEVLREIGVVALVDLGVGRTVYHAVLGAQHHHLVCSGCGEVVELPAELLEEVADVVVASYGFALDQSHLVLSGTCLSCR